jgi:lipoprotein-anchoring transpeptidase ErfK/SrfK
MRVRSIVLVLALAGAAACERVERRERAERERPVAEAGEDRGVATAIASGRAELSPEELEAGRLDRSWRRYARPGEADPGAPGRAATTGGAAQAEVWEDISPDRVNRPAVLPVGADAQGPSAAKVQVLLDRARFSPGIIDGRWGKNTEKAVYWFQVANGLEATGEVDAATMEALLRRGGGEQVRRHRLSERDVEGPFVAIPDDIYERADLDCQCYESLREKLGEVFHSSPELLEQLNPGVDLNGVAAGDGLQVPVVEPFHVSALPEGRYTSRGEVRRLVISVGGHFLHALDGAGNILYHFPSTLGADYSPSPEGEHLVESVHFHPAWHYQPALLSHVDDHDDDAVIAAGPNNDVGIVWMALSKPHYGIHGTRAPETIGYATSAGCVRLTNWDAALLGRRVAEVTPVEFVHVDAEDR